MMITASTTATMGHDEFMFGTANQDVVRHGRSVTLRACAAAPPAIVDGGKNPPISFVYSLSLRPKKVKPKFRPPRQELAPRRENKAATSRRLIVLSPLL